MLDAVEEARTVLGAASPSVDDGADLDRAMDRVQVALAGIGEAISARFLEVPTSG